MQVANNMIVIAFIYLQQFLLFQFPYNYPMMSDSGVGVRKSHGRPIGRASFFIKHFLNSLHRYGTSMYVGLLQFMRIVFKLVLMLILYVFKTLIVMMY